MEVASKKILDTNPGIRRNKKERVDPRNIIGNCQLRALFKSEVLTARNVRIPNYCIYYTANIRYFTLLLADEANLLF